jgi:hypothetical protein
MPGTDHLSLLEALPDRCIFRIAGDEQDLQLLAEHPSGVGQLTAIHAARQANICDHDVDVSFAFQDLKRGRAVRGVRTL